MITRTPHQLYSHIAAQLQPNEAYLVALSGGVDSVVLLHLLHKLHKQRAIASLRAVHVNHGLQEGAWEWQQFCQDYCDKLGVPLIVRHLHFQKNTHQALVTNDCENAVNQPHLTLEGKARRERYRAFHAALMENEAANHTLLLAHHADDAAETLLLKLWRGTSSRGAFLPAHGKLGQFQLMRPLLRYTKADILAYAQQYTLDWREDDSNADRRYARNFVRHNIIGALQKHSRQALAGIARSSERLDTQFALLDEYAQTELTGCVGTDGALCVSRLCEKSALRHEKGTNEPKDHGKSSKDKARLLLATWLKSHAIAIRNAAQLDAIVSLCYPAATGEVRAMQLGYHGHRTCWVRRFADWLYLVPQYAPDLQSQPLVDMHHIERPQGTLRLMTGGILSLSQDTLSQATIRFRAGGEIMRLGGMTRTLKTLWQTWRVPPWQRAVWPLVFVHDKLICVPNHACADGWCSTDNESKQIHWQPACITRDVDTPDMRLQDADAF